MEDMGYVMSIGIFLSFLLAITGYIQISFPAFQIISGFDFALLGASFIAVAGICVLATGIPCAAAMGFFGFANFLIFSNTVAWVIFTPLTLSMAFLIAKLGRGTV
jgi:hypothetical protein